MRVLFCSTVPTIMSTCMEAAVDYAGMEFAAIGEADLMGTLAADPEAMAVICGSATLTEIEVQHIREAGIENRIIALLHPGVNARETAIHHARTLMAGADDAQPIGIDPRELGARLRALASRQGYVDPTAIRLPGGIFDPQTGDVIAANGNSARLTLMEAKFLSAICDRQGAVVTNAAIMESVYGYDGGPEGNIINQMACNVRRKIRQVLSVDVLRRVWGTGYAFVEDGLAPYQNGRRAS